jgi:hypothetical protein
LRLVGSFEQLFPDRWPVPFQEAGKTIDRHPIDARAAFVGPQSSQGFLQVFSLTDFLHQLFSVNWVFGFIPRPGRFGLFSANGPGFTRPRTREVQCSLEILPRIIPEIHVPLALLLVRAFDPRFRFGLSVDSTFRY